MQQRIYPVEGRLVLMPERNFAPVPPEGAVVDTAQPLYVRALSDEDITLTPPEPITVVAPESVAEEPEDQE